MREQTVFDLVIIGSGPGGYVAAIRAAQLGLKTACVEKARSLGGTCLNVGCIPSKALLESSEHYISARKHLKQHGIRVEGVSIDVGAMMARKDRVVKTLTSGIAMLFKKNGVTQVTGTGRVVAPDAVEVTGGEETTRLRTRRILIATGSTVAVPRGFRLDGKYVVSSTEALEFDAVPKRLVIIGAGVIGLELGSVWARLGAKVTLIELLPRILAGFDSELATTAQKLFQRQGMKFILGARVGRAEIVGQEVEVGYDDKDGNARSITCDRLLVSVGRRPYTEGLGLEDLGIEMDGHGRIAVDASYQTSVPGIYAVGDVIAGPMLAHKAQEEGVAAVEMMAGHVAKVDYDAIPAIAYTQPEIATVGATEDALKEQGVPYARGTFPFQANGRAKAMGQADGWVKVLADSRTDRILGAHIIGPRAGDLIAELALAIAFEGSSEDVARSCHAHPTLAEVVKEACLAVEGQPIHM